MARRRKLNEFPFVPVAGPTTFFATGTADNDPIGTNIMPSDGRIGHATVTGITNGTGTALVTVAWYSGAARAGTKLTPSLVNAAGTVYDLDAAAGIVYSNDVEQGAQVDFVVEGSRIFLNFDFDAGTATGTGTFAAAFFLVL